MFKLDVILEWEKKNSLKKEEISGVSGAAYLAGKEKRRRKGKKANEEAAEIKKKLGAHKLKKKPTQALRTDTRKNIIALCVLSAPLLLCSKSVPKILFTQATIN